MQGISSFERVVGNIPETEKEQILQNKGEIFDSQIFEDLRDKEREKTPEELEIISLVNKATNEVRQRYGLKNFNIPPANIHVIMEEAWPREKSVALYNAMVQAVAVREQPAKIIFMEKVFHEMLHFKSYNALQISTGENPKLRDYRAGLTIHTRDGKEMYFTNLNEAVTEEMTRRFAAKLFDNPLFIKEQKQTRDIMAKYPRAITDSGEPLFSSDTFYAEIESRKSWSAAVGRLFGAREKITAESFTYRQERRSLNTLINKLFTRNQKRFKDRAEVFEVFSQGMMTGNILPIGRLIEETFGNGTLRAIGELDNDIGKQSAFISTL